MTDAWKERKLTLTLLAIHKTKMVDRVIHRYRDQFPNVDNVVDALLYDLTDGGDTVRGKSWLTPALKSHMRHLCKLYHETHFLSPETINKQIDLWLSVNEKKGNLSS
jgi:hypothetical protein